MHICITLISLGLLTLLTADMAVGGYGANNLNELGLPMPGDWITKHCRSSYASRGMLRGRNHWRSVVLRRLRGIVENS